MRRDRPFGMVLAQAPNLSETARSPRAIRRRG